jgi:hypothetical protein
MDRAQLKTLGLAFGRSIYSAFKTVVMYSVDHPASERALQQAYDTLSALLAQAPQFTFGFLNHRLILNDLLTDEPLLRPFEAELTRRGIATITFTGGISQVELKRALSLLAAKPKAIEGAGGIQAFLAAHPLSGARVTLAKKEEGGDTVLEGDTESILKGEASRGQGPGGGSGGGQALEALLQFAGMERESGALLKGHEILDVAGKATEAALLGQTTDPQGVVEALSRLVEEVTPESVLSALPMGKQAALRGRPAADIAADVVEDVTAGLVANRLASAPAGPAAAAAESEAIRVMTLGLSMTRMADRLLQKLGRMLEEANLPPEVFERIRQGILWSGLSQEEKRKQILQVTEYDDQAFRRLLDYVKECLQARKIDQAVEAATHYFGFLDGSSAAVRAELPRSLELLRAMAEPATLPFLSSIAERLGGALLDEARLLDRECHALVADSLVSVVQMAAPQGDFDLAHRAGAALEQSRARDQREHAECCEKALVRLFPPEAAGRLIDLYMEKRGDAGLTKTTLELLRWMGPASGEEAFRRLVEEKVTPNRMLLLRLLTQLGAAGVEAARNRLADERWYVVRNACVVLGDLGDPEIARDMHGALRHADGRVQQAGVTALVKSQAPEATTALADALPALEARVAELALDELSFRKDPATIDGLEKFLQLSKGTKPGALEKAVYALGVIHAERAVRVLGVVLADTGQVPLVRRAAADGLLRSTQPVARRLLEAYVRVAPNEPVAASIQRALQRTAPR